MRHEARQLPAWLIFDVGQIVQDSATIVILRTKDSCLALLMAVMLTGCLTGNVRESSLEKMAKVFSEYYAKLHQSPGKILHLQARNPEAVSLVKVMRYAFPSAVVVKTDGRFSETEFGVVDLETGSECVAVGVTLWIESSTEALIDVTWSSGTRNWSLMTYVLSLKNGTWKVTGYRLGAISNKKPNKAPEPTPGLVTPRALESVFEMKRWNESRNVARGAPSPGVAHL